MQTSWLASEKKRELCRFRTALLDGLENKKETAASILEEAAETAELGPEGKLAAKTAAEWLETPNAAIPDSPMVSPEEQAAWGFAILAKTKSETETGPEIPKFLKVNQRLQRELHMMAALLLGTVKNKNTKIGWGTPGSWFYHNPVEHRINMDPAMAMLLGLQNCRAICMHEIGHAAITRGRSPKIVALIEKLTKLQKPENGQQVIKPEDAQEVAKLAEEYSLRENFWQYAQDAAVNAYAEMESQGFPTNIKQAQLRCYAATIMGRDLSRTGSDPMAKLIEAIQKMTLTPEQQALQEKRKKGLEVIRERLQAASCAYPISRDWMDTENPEDWKSIGTQKTPETISIVEKLSGKEGLAGIQPSLAASRLELLQDLGEEITKRCDDQRNLLCDQIFDQYIQPELDKLPPPPAQATKLVWTPAQKPSKEKSEEKGKEKAGKEGENKTEVEEITLEEGQKLLEASQSASDPRDKELKEQIQGQAAKNSMGSKSPLDTLPDDCTSYEDTISKCGAQIQHVSKILAAIKTNQDKPGRQTPAFLPERSLREFDLDAYIRTQQKMAGGDMPTPEEFRFFKKTQKKKTPALTRFGFYIDGSGSMNGDQTKKTMVTLIIFSEAARRVGGITVTAVYSGAEATELLLSGKKPTEKETTTIASLLKNGHARGDNEICPGGLKELSQALRQSTPPNEIIGATHYVFLTDGGSCSSHSELIQKSLETVLNGNPNTTFDTVVVDGSEGKPFRLVSEATRPTRQTQTPQIVTAKTTNEIASAACNLLTKRIRQIKSFSPQIATNVANLAKRTEKRLAEQEQTSPI